MNTHDLKNKPDRFDGWLAGSMSVALAFAAAVLAVWQQSAASWDVFFSPSQFVRVSIIGIILVSLAIVWTAIVFGLLRSFFGNRGVILIFAILPSLTLASVNAIRCIQYPPSPDSYFRRFFETSLPDTATNISIRPDNMADPGHVGFHFETTPNQVQTLIDALQLRRVPADLSEFMLPFRIPNIAEPTPITAFTWFEHVQPNGCGIILATNHARTQIFLTREPGYDKSEDE
jgi:hypothetical protein